MRGQSNSITISNRLFDQFARIAISEKGLRQDTAILKSIVKKKDTVINDLKSDTSLYGQKFRAANDVKNNYKEKAEKYSEKIETLKGRNKKLIKVVFGLGTIVAIEAVRVYFEIKSKLN